MNYSKIPFVEVIKKQTEILNNFGRISGKCDGVKCESCPFRVLKSCAIEHYKNPENLVKLIMEYDCEPKIDWDKVSVDIKVLVRNDKTEEWQKRYFARFKNNLVYCWNNGTTSFSTINYKDVNGWKYAKLYRNDES